MRGEVERAERARVRGRFRESELVEAAPHPDPLHSPSKTGVNALKASGQREHGTKSLRDSGEVRLVLSDIPMEEIVGSGGSALS
jgi:hypothetical protein